MAYNTIIYNNKTLIDYTLDDLINEFEKIKIS